MSNNTITNSIFAHNLEERNRYLSSLFEEVSCYDFYRYIFPEQSFSPFGHQEVKKPNGILRRLDDSDANGANRDYLVFDDLDRLSLADNYPFALMAPIAYSGNHANGKNAYVLHGFALDVDDIDKTKLDTLLLYIQEDTIPRPTFIVSSGTGLHLYYVLDSPEPLQRYKRKRLDNLKRGLTKLLWDDSYITSKRQTYQGIYQMYRMPGSQTKLGEGYLVKAFRVGDRISIEELNDYVSDEYQADFASHLTLEEASSRYPEWFSNLNNKTRKTFKSSKYLYDWWLAKLALGTFKGNRYWCVVATYVYGCKCDVPVEQVRQDVMAWIGHLEEISDVDPFTEEDIAAAETYYSEQAKLVRRSTIEAWTGIKIEPAKRNTGEAHRKRSKADAEKLGQNCALVENAIGVRDELYPDGTWRGSGRPKNHSKEKMAVINWKKEHEGEDKLTRRRCAQELGVSEKTVGRWWNEEIDYELVNRKGRERWENFKRIQEWKDGHEDNPSINDCAKDLGIARYKVRELWNRDEDWWLLKYIQNGRFVLGDDD